MDVNTLFKTVAHSVSLMFLFLHHVSGQTVVEGFVGGSVILPCTLTPSGDLSWRQGRFTILVKPAGGPVIIDTGPYNGDVSLVNSHDLRISPLRRPRDGAVDGVNTAFACQYTGGDGGRIETTLRLIDPVKITGVSISETFNGGITVRVGTHKTLTCSVSGVPKPAPSYTWSINGGTVIGQASSSYTLNPDKSMRTIKCTATNRITDGSVFSQEETTATLNVLFLDLPLTTDVSTIIENSTVSLQCSAKGNPPPRFEWSKSTSSEVLHEKDLYVIENVQRSAAGTYTCTVINAVTVHSRTTNLIVQYPPDVTVSYDKATQTLTCRAEGVPDSYSYSQWEHQLDGKLLQTLGQQPTLNLPGPLTYEDTGYYVCQVSNGIKSPQRGQVFVTPQSPALFETQTHSLTLKERENNSISVPFYTYSDTPDVKVVWEKSGESTVLTSHREETGPVRLMIRGQSVIIEGTVTVLTLRDVTQSDEGNYTVTVTNYFNSVSLSNQITFSVFVTPLSTSRPGSPSQSPTLTEGLPLTGETDEGESGVNIEAAAVGGGIAGLAVIVIVILSVLLFRAKRKKPNETIRPPGEQAVSQFQTNRQEGGVYQDLTINPDYMNTTENQPYAILGEKARDATDYEQCDVPMNETKRDDDKKVPQYEDVSFSAEEAKHGYIDVCSNDSENKDYENKVFQSEASKTYYNL